MPENIENKMEKKWYSLIFPEIFRADAAGRISRALIIKIPTHLMDTITINAVSTAKRFSIHATEMPLLDANVLFRLTANSLLNPNSQNKRVIIKIKTRYKISLGVMLKMSPTKILEYLLKFPPLDKIARPRATLKEENTEMTVSVDEATRLLIWFRSNANAMANTAIERFVSSTPSTTPSAIPVSAECPNASEKNAIFRLTIIVPINPNKGVITKIAKKAYLIKSYCTQEKIPIYVSSLPFWGNAAPA